MVLLIGGIVCCCYPGCKAVLPDVQSYYEHCELVHDGEDDGERGDIAYAEGLRREA